MKSITRIKLHGQGPEVNTSYKYAFRVRPQDAADLPYEELLELCLELYTILYFVIGVIRNPMAEISTRVIAIDIFIDRVWANARNVISGVCDAVPTLMQGDVAEGGLREGIADRLGLSRNSVRAACDDMVLYEAAERSYRRGMHGPKEHMDFALSPQFLRDPAILLGKKKRAEPAAKLVEKKEEPKPAICGHCGSENVVITCLDCSGVTSMAKEPVVPAEEVPVPQAIIPVVEVVKRQRRLQGAPVVDIPEMPSLGDVFGNVHAELARARTPQKPRVEEIPSFHHDTTMMGDAIEQADRPPKPTSGGNCWGCKRSIEWAYVPEVGRWLCSCYHHPEWRERAHAKEAVKVVDFATGTVQEVPR